MTKLEQPIVVAVDGSSRDPDALRFGGELAGLLHAAIIIAHVHPYGELGDLLGEGEQKRVLRSLAEEVRERAAAQLEGRPLTMRLLADRSAPRALHRLAATDRARMIVVGASERRRVGMIRPGSTSERIIQGSTCPVAVAPADYASRAEIELDCIGCGFDAQPPAHAALAEAAGLAAAAEAHLRLIAVFQPLAFGHLPAAPPRDLGTANATVRSMLERQLADAVAGIAHLDVDSLILEGEPGERLVEQTDSLDLLVVGGRGYGPVRSVLLGGVSGHVIRSARCPVVVCPADPG